MENNDLATSIIEYIEKQYGNTISESVIDKYKTDIQRIVKEEITNIGRHLSEIDDSQVSMTDNVDVWELAETTLSEDYPKSRYDYIEETDYKRKDMPQVKTQDLGKALSMVKSKVNVTKLNILATKLKKSQKELYGYKVKGIAGSFTSPDKLKPLIISKDNHIIDGHHRWAAAIYKFGKSVKIPVFRIGLPKDKALELYKQIAHSINEDISIPINIGDTVLMGKFKNKRVVIKSITKNEKGDYLINGKPAFKFRLIKET